MGRRAQFTGTAGFILIFIILLILYLLALPPDIRLKLLS